MLLLWFTETKHEATLLFGLLLLAFMPVTNENYAMQKKERRKWWFSSGSETQDQLRRDGKNHVPKKAVFDRFWLFLFQCLSKYRRNMRPHSFHWHFTKSADKIWNLTIKLNGLIWNLHWKSSCDPPQLSAAAAPAARPNQAREEET